MRNQVRCKGYKDGKNARLWYPRDSYQKVMELAGSTLYKEKSLNLYTYRKGFRDGIENLVRGDSMATNTYKTKTTPEKGVKKIPYINKVMFSGTLGKDFEGSFTQSGKEFWKSSLAVWFSGKPDALTAWYDVVFWVNDGEQDSFTEELSQFKKGDKVVVTGRLGMRKYDGKTYYTITLDGDTNCIYLNV